MSIEETAVKIYYIVVATAIIFVILTWLALRSGENYSVQDKNAHSTNYTDIIKKEHSGLTLLLRVCFITIFIWIIVYFIQYWSELLG